MSMTIDNWVPRTELGKKVMNNEITLDEIFKQGKKISEPEIKRVCEELHLRGGDRLEILVLPNRNLMLKP